MRTLLQNATVAELLCLAILYRGQQSHHLTCCKCPSAMAPGGVVNHVRYVVIDQEPAEPTGVQSSHGGSDINVAFAKKALVEDWDAALYVTEVDVENLILR